MKPDPEGTKMKNDWWDKKDIRQLRFYHQLGRRAIEGLEKLECPTIARVHGHAIGGGFGLMLACDLRVVTEEARLYLPEVNIKVPLTWGLSARLARDVGFSKAKELIWMCQDISPKDALGLGLVNLVVSGESALDKTINRMARHLCSQDPTAIHQSKIQFLSMQHQTQTGDVTHYDGDQLFLSAIVNGSIGGRKSKLARL